MKTIISTLIFCATLLISLNSESQSVNYSTFGKGLQFIAKDSSFYLKLRFRFQTLYSGSYNLETDQYSDNIQIRRARLKFDGFVLNPRVKYKIELSLSNRDLSGGVDETSNTPRLIRDAVLMWNFARNWHVWFGQTKLPGNRERVISSGSLQFVDRSLMNSRYNIDRDVGVQLHNSTQMGNGIFNQSYSISMGEGQNITANNTGGYDYTIRYEYLPFGKFTNKGDYFGSDLERESKPKLSIGIVYDFNNGATRQRGQNGDFMYDTLGNRLENNLSSVFVDAMFKYQGFSIMSEFVYKKPENDVFGVNVEGDLVKYATGDGFVFQTGYLFKNNFEIAGRYSFINPDNLQYSSIVEEDVYTIGISKYIKAHNLKVQVNSSYRDITGNDDQIRFRFQVEMQL